MHKYEIVYIFRSSLPSEEIDSKLATLHEQLTGREGQISAVEHWGKRQLAYPIDKERNGYYVVAQFETEPDSLPGFERLLRLQDDLLRYLIVLSEGELPIPASMRPEGAASESAKTGPARSGEPKADEGSAEGEQKGETGAEGEVSATSEEEDAGEPELVAEADAGDEPAEQVAEAGGGDEPAEPVAAIDEGGEPEEVAVAPEKEI